MKLGPTGLPGSRAGSVVTVALKTTVHAENVSVQARPTAASVSLIRPLRTKGVICQMADEGHVWP